MLLKPECLGIIYMKHLHETIEVPMQVADVFRFVADFGRISEWDPGVVESTRLSRGPVGKGTRFRVVIRSGIGHSEMEYTITEYEPPRRVVLEGLGDAIEAVDEIRFSRSGAGTRIDYRADIRLRGVAGAIEPLLGPLLERVGRKAMAGLERALTPASEAPSESLARDLLDRLILPGALGFTRLGYALRRLSWRPLSESLAGRTAVITGATSGLGRVVAERLADLGARTILVGRDAGRLQRAAREIRESTGNQAVVTERADLRLMSEVRALAHRLLDREAALHLLINNAAVLPTERTHTPEGLETAFATNLLSPWLLTRLLLPRLRDSAPSRIVNVTSGGMYLSGLDAAATEDPDGPYDGSRAYARAKRGLMVLTELWAEELSGSGVVVNAMHPGWADTPGVRNSLPGFYRLTRPVLRTPEQGADTIVWLAAATEAGKVSGKLWLDREPHLSAILPGTAGSTEERERLVDTLSRIAA